MQLMQLLNRPWLIALTRIVTLAIAAAAVLAGCTRTVTQTVTRDVVRPAPTPSLLGTWTGTEQVRDDNGVLTGTHVYTLTFTKSRAIATASIRNLAGRECDRWDTAGTWSATDTSVVRGRLNEPSITKNYAFADEGNVLFVNPWFWDHATEAYWPYTRIATPIQDLLTGTWESEHTSDDGTVTWRRSMSFSGNSFTYRSGDPEGESSTQLEGPYRHDVENGFIMVTISTVTKTEDGKPVEPEEAFVGHTLRWAYAPTERPDMIAVSPYFNEQAWNPNTRTWEDDVEFSYWEEYERPDRAD